MLFAGGGLVGLSTAMFLAQHGIPSLAIERLKQGSHLPRAAHFHMRTLEMFRSAGIEDEVRAKSLEEFEPEGSIVMMDTLAGKVLVEFIPSLNAGVDAFSPCRRLFVTQPGLEPILRRRAEAAGARIFEDTPAVTIDAAGVRKRIGTPSGRVRAGHVVLAGNVHLGALMPRLAATLLPVTTFVLVTEPPSNTTQLIPARSVVIAAASPHGPAPTMATSTLSSTFTAITRPR